MKFIHVSDFHLVAPGVSLWGTTPSEQAERCLEDIVRWHGDAAFCVISGDLADGTYEAAYRWLHERLRSFPLKTFLMTGNHDDRDAMIAHLPGLPVDDHGFVQQSHETAEGIFLFLDTFKGEGSAGQYCEKRQAWLRRELEVAAGRPVWIFMHHPPRDIGIPYMDRIKLDEAAAFADILSGFSNVRHIFFGHVHRPVFLTWNGITCSAVPGTNHQVPLTRDSVTTNYSHEPPMYAVVSIDGGNMIVHYDAYLNRSSADMSDGPKA